MNKSDQRLKVLFLSDLFPNSVSPAFGIFVERQAFHLLEYCDITVVAPVRVFPPLRLWKQINRPSKFMRGWRRWRAELVGIPPHDLVNDIPVFYPRYTSPPKPVFHALWGFFAYPFVKPLLRKLTQAHPFDLIHAHYASPCGVIALLAQPWMGIPIVLTVHGGDINYTVKQNIVSAKIVKWVFQNVDFVCVNSTRTARKVIESGAYLERVTVVPLGGNPTPAYKSGCYPSSTQIIERHTIQLLTIGYLVPHKGHAYVLRAVRRLIDLGYRIKYTIVGDGELAEHLCKLAGELGIAEHVSFEGYKSHAEVWQYYADCDIFVLASWDEAFGVVYVEALSMGKPIVGCEGQGGPEDLYRLGKCVTLVKSKDVESLVEALRRLLDNPSERVQMGELGRAVVQEHFTWEKNAQDTVGIYQRVLT